MACEKCNHTGIITIPMLKDNSTTKLMTKACPFCKDSKAYYRYIKEKYGSKPDNTQTTTRQHSNEQHTEAKILQFKSLKK